MVTGLVTVCIGLLLWFLALLVVPEQLIDDIRRGDKVGIVSHQPQQKSPILFQVAIIEAAQKIITGPGSFILKLFLVDVVPEKSHSVGPADRPEQPHQHTHGSEDDQKEHPKVEKQVHFLSKQVDGQDTLHRVALDVTKETNVEVTHGNTGKHGGDGIVVVNLQNVEVLDSKPAHDKIDIYKIKSSRLTGLLAC